MTASERLAALESRDSLGNKFQTQPEQQVLYAALPEIVAVVRAAEKAEHEYELRRVGADDGEFALWSEERLYTTLHALAPALAALDAKLAEK